MSSHEKNYTSEDIRLSENETGEIIMDKETIDKARISVERMALAINKCQNKTKQRIYQKYS